MQSRRRGGRKKKERKRGFKEGREEERGRKGGREQERIEGRIRQGKDRGEGRDERRKQHEEKAKENGRKELKQNTVEAPPPNPSETQIDNEQIYLDKYINKTTKK